MASIDDVFLELKDLSAKLWRGYSPVPGGQIGLGMVPDVQRQVTALTARVEEIERRVTETQVLLNAVNVETLGRIETAVTDGREYLIAVNEQTLGRIETEIKEGLQFLPTLRQDMTDVQARLDGLKTDIQGLANTP